MSYEEKKQDKKSLLIGTVIGAIVLFLIVLVANLEALNTWISGLWRLFRPIILGLALAYLCNPFFRFFERKVFYSLRPQSLRRTLSLICTYLSVLLIIALILLLILPQLIDSIIAFVGNYKAYLSSAIHQINGVYASINRLVFRITNNESFLEYLDEEALIKKVQSILSGEGSGFNLIDYLENINIQVITDTLGNLVSIIADSLFAFFISLYFLSTKEKRYAQIMKLRHALFSDTVNSKITKLCTTIDKAFGGFLEGKLLDGLIVGILTYIVISLFRIPYAILIATFIAITNLIPVIGPLIGAIPASLILLLSAPNKVIPFLIIMVIIQQIDANIITPKILGSNTGVSSLCVVIAISTVGALWGVVGLFLSVPLFATILELFDTYLISRLQRKGIPSGIENHYAIDSIVDPAKTSDQATDKTAQKLETAALRIQNKLNEGKKINLLEKFLLRVYSITTKHHLFAERTDEEYAHFSADQALKDARTEAVLYLQSRKADEPTADADTDSNI